MATTIHSHPSVPLIVHSPPASASFTSVSLPHAHIGYTTIGAAGLAQLKLAFRTRLQLTNGAATPAAAATVVVVPAVNVAPSADAKPPPKNAKKNKKKARAEKKEDEFLFTAQYGANFAALAPWVQLCRDLGVDGELKSKTACKKALANVHVNIYDFLNAVDARQRAAGAEPDAIRSAAILAARVPVHFFSSEAELAAYTISTRRVYPRAEIRRNTDHPLRLLMAHIRFPRKARRGAISV